MIEETDLRLRKEPGKKKEIVYVYCTFMKTRIAENKIFFVKVYLQIRNFDKDFANFRIKMRRFVNDNLGFFEIPTTL